ncbi:MAG: ATP-binding protein [Pseudomonadota bacterium]
MINHKGLLEVLVTINSISLEKGLEFEEKSQRILFEIVRFMGAKSASIMLLKGRKALEVIASTDMKMNRVRQPLDQESPSTWVIKNRAPLYIKDISENDTFLKKFDHYKGCAFLLVPITGYEKVIGVISVTDKIGMDLFSKEEEKALLSIAGQVISALENQRLTESLKRKRRILQKKNLQLGKLEKLKTDLFNMLIHDLKGPISELVANLDILSYTAADDNKEYVEAAMMGCNTLYKMVCNLLDITRLEEGRLQLLYERIDPRDLIKESIAMLFGLGKMKELTFLEKYPSIGASKFFCGDRGILLRVLQNLLTNAINYSPRGEAIEMGFEYLNTPDIKFFVKDNGPGVPPDYQEAIFDKFFQLEKKGYTTGLGLTFCKMAVDAHKGKIRVVSRNFEGSRFFFILPLENKEKNKTKLSRLSGP